MAVSFFILSGSSFRITLSFKRGSNNPVTTKIWLFRQMSWYCYLHAYLFASSKTFRKGFSLDITNYGLIKLQQNRDSTAGKLNCQLEAGDWVYQNFQVDRLF